MGTTQKMAEKHEAFLSILFNGRRTKASGSQWSDQMDGRHNQEQEFSFAWDGKSTFGKSIGISRVMWEKAKEQAASWRPMLALRFYDTEALDVGVDLAVVSASDLAELIEKANHVEPVRIFACWHGNRTEGPPSPKPLMVIDGKVIVLKGFEVRRSTSPRLIERGEGTFPEVEVDDRVTAVKVWDEEHNEEIPLGDRQVEVYMDNVIVARTGVQFMKKQFGPITEAEW